MSPIKGKWKGIIRLYSCCKYTSLYMTKLVSVWNRANGAARRWRRLGGYFCCVAASEWELVPDLILASQEGRMFLRWPPSWTAEPFDCLLYSSSITGPSIWDTWVGTLQLTFISSFCTQTRWLWCYVADNLFSAVSCQMKSWSGVEAAHHGPTCLQDTFNINCWFEYETGCFCCLGNCSNSIQLPSHPAYPSLFIRIVIICPDLPCPSVSDIFWSISFLTVTWTTSRQTVLPDSLIYLRRPSECIQHHSHARSSGKNRKQKHACTPTPVFPDIPWFFFTVCLTWFKVKEKKINPKTFGSFDHNYISIR